MHYPIIGMSVVRKVHPSSIRAPKCYIPMDLRNLADFGTMHEGNYEKIRIKSDNFRQFNSNFS